MLLYGLKLCPLNKLQVASLDFVVNSFFMKLFNTGDFDTVHLNLLEVFRFRSN